MKRLSILPCLLLLAAGTVQQKDEFKPDLSKMTIDERIDKLKSKEKAGEILTLIKNYRETAAKVIHENLGIKDPIQVHISISERSGRMVAGTRGHKDRVIMFFCVQDIVLQKYTNQEVEMTMAHELIHVCFLNKNPDYYERQLPLWVREGMSVFGAGQIPSQVKRAMSQYKNKPENIVNGLEHPRVEYGDYVESALAYEYIKEKHGADKVKQLIAGLLEGAKNYRELIKDATGEDFDKFQESAKQFALEYLGKIK